MDLVMECKYTAGYVVNAGRKMMIQPGQLVGAISWLASRWNWTPKTVRVFLDQLQQDEMISRSAIGPSGDSTTPQRGNRGGNQANVITICNYSKYQLIQDDEGQAIGQSEGKRGASEGQARGNIYKEEQLNKGTKEQEDRYAAPAAEPQAPQAIDKNTILAAMGLDQRQFDAMREMADPVRMEAFEKFAAKEAQKRLRAERTASENSKRQADADEAYSVYNKAAAHWRFALCEARTEARTRKLLERIDQIGGMENFKIALRTIGKDPFLSGKVPPRPGQKPFRLDIERLLSTESGLGDVLAKLLDLANSTKEPESPNGKVWGWWASNIEKLRALPPDYWRQRIATLKPNGTWPWWELGAPPGHPEAIVHPDVVAELKLDEIYKGKVQHE